MKNNKVAGYRGRAVKKSNMVDVLHEVIQQAWTSETLLFRFKCSENTNFITL
jgi:hypothetical protein